MSCDKGLFELRQSFSKIMKSYFGCSPEQGNAEQFYRAALILTREYALERLASAVKRDGKRVHYLSMEFLPGKMLRHSLRNLGIEAELSMVFSKYGFDPQRIFDLDVDLALGNGGLGRLAVCFMESMSSLGIDGVGHTLLYRYGYFRQQIENGEQRELPDYATQRAAEAFVPRRDETVTVTFGGNVIERWDRKQMHITRLGGRTFCAVPYDLPIPGAGGAVSSKIRAWSAEAHFEDASGGVGEATVADSLAAQLTAFLYPPDETSDGQRLRLAQEYFLSSAAVQSAVREHLCHAGSIQDFAGGNALHINDTHPALAIPELMRLLMDEHALGWEEAWKITLQAFSYTNHTVMPEALEIRSCEMLASLLPRIYAIICEINRRESIEAREKALPDKLLRDTAVIDDGSVRMANLSVLASHRMNGVSQIHTEILRREVLEGFEERFPGRILNITNGIVWRRWLCEANPELSELLCECIGEEFLDDARHLKRFAAFADDSTVQEELLRIRRKNKDDLCRYIKHACGKKLSPDACFDVQIKRIHEYKRQLLNILKILSILVTLSSDQHAELIPQVFLFAGKAAPSYHFAKEIIRLIASLSEECRKNPHTRGRLEVCFLEDYNVSLAERIIPAADFSEQISLAGTEASGTGNMKLMLNGALTIGTRDGANLEIAREAGEENVWLFGPDSPKVAEIKRAGNDPEQLISTSPMLSAILNLLESGIGGKKFSNIAEYLRYSDPFLCTTDFAEYCETYQKAIAESGDRAILAKKAILNISAAGYFSADRAIKEYAQKIWML